MAEFAVFRGVGGGLHRFQLPLAPAFAALEAKGLLVREDEEPPSAPKPRPKPVDVDGEDADLGPVRPSQASPKAQWVDYAQLVSDLSHDEAQALTKAELVDRFGS